VHGVWVNGVQVADAKGGTDLAGRDVAGRPGRLLRSVNS